MKKKIALMVALGCIGASAASVNYDILGRKGSKMNSPMVYKNADYSKVQKNEQQKVGSSLENRALAKKGPGIKGSYVALTGAFNSMGFNHQSRSGQSTSSYYLKRIKPSGDPEEYWYSSLTGSKGYVKDANTAFIPVTLDANNNLKKYYPSYEYGNGWTNVSSYQSHFSMQDFSFDNPVQPSPYSYYGDVSIRYVPFDVMKVLFSEEYTISWYNNPQGNDASQWGDVGVYLDVDARPIQLDASKSVPYLRHLNNEQFNPTDNSEILSSRMHSVVKAVTKHSSTDYVSVYIGKENPVDPADNSRPQIYVGVHPGVDTYNPDEDKTLYADDARNLDNYIYEKRTVEVVAAGNNCVRLNNCQISKQGHAANAITVGAMDLLTGSPTSYSSNASYFCRNGQTTCTRSYAYPYYKKPEIYNYSHFYMNDRKITYQNTNYDLVFNPYYDGTQMAAAYTAGMVADLMASNAFYRWHPEVVKALLMTSSVVSGRNVPTYRTMMPQIGSSDGVVHESRYWIGDINKLMGSGNIWQVAFGVKRPSGATKFTAAITWLNRGSDIGVHKRYPHPQHFRLLAFPSRTGDFDIEFHNPQTATELEQNYQLMTGSLTQDYEYFMIQFMDEDASSDDYKGQIVLGFDVAFY